jgi:hypothetical protein
MHESCPSPSDFYPCNFKQRVLCVVCVPLASHLMCKMCVLWCAIFVHYIYIYDKDIRQSDIT